MNNMDKKLLDIGARLKNRRTELNFSLMDLSKLTGIPKQTLQRYEVGKIKNVPASRLDLIAASLNVTPEWLLGWEDKKPAKENGELLGELLTIVKNFPDEEFRKLIEHAKDREELLRARSKK
jgi:transcriptional regulator with XRE-family HTH domain